MGEAGMQNWWKNYPWRMIQTNFREIDMENIEAESYVKSLKDFDATVALINVGGLLASYKTKVEDHTKSSFLHGSSLKTIMDTCHREGIRVLARMDFSKASEEVFIHHPDWAYRRPDGHIVNYNGYVHMCISGDFLQKKSLEIMKEVLKTLPIDGVFFNMGGFKTRDYSYNYHGICHCENCKRRFKEFSGLELPDKENMDDPVFRTYKAFQEKLVGETNRRLYRMIKSIRPDTLIGGLDFMRTETKTEYGSKDAPWNYGSASVARGGSSVEGSPLITNAAVDFIGFRYRHNSVGKERMELRFCQDIANFCGLDYYIMGPLEGHMDRSSYPVVKKAFAYMKRNEKTYQDMRMYKNVLVVRNGGNDQLTEESKGWIKALTESHIPFGEVGPNVIKEETDLSAFKAVIIPCLEKVPAPLAAKLDAFVSQGGTLILSGANNYYDSLYNKYETIPYASMQRTGIRKIVDDQISGMLRIRENDRKELPSLADTDVLYFGEDYAFCDYPQSAAKHLSFIPPHTYGPPELCYPREETEDPGYVVYSYGKGKVIYITWNIGKRFHMDGYLSLFYLMKDILTQSAGLESVEDSPFTPMVEVTLGTSEDGERMMVHLVNGTGCFGGSVYAPVPVYGIKLRVPSSSRPSSIVDIESGESIDFSYSDGYVHLEVDRVEMLRALEIRF